MLKVHTLTETAPTPTGVRLFVGLVTDNPKTALEWVAKLEGMVSETVPNTDVPSSNVNPTVEKIIRAALDDGADLDPNRYDPLFKALIEVTTAGPNHEISIKDLADRLGLKVGTVRTMNTKLSIRIGRVLEKRAGELKNAVPPFPALDRNIDALLKVTWDKGNPSYRFQPSALPAVQDWLSTRT